VRAYNNFLLNPATQAECDCCASPAPQIRLNYLPRGASNPIHTVEQSMSRSGNIITIVPYRSAPPAAPWQNETEWGVYLEVVGECCVRLKLNIPEQIRCGVAQVGDLPGQYTVGGLGQRHSSYECLGYVDCGSGNDIPEWVCCSKMTFVWWKDYDGAYPTWLDGFTIEIDPDYTC